MTDEPLRLSDAGPVRLSATAEASARRAGLSPSDALRLSMRATAVDRMEVPERWRSRARSTGWDLSLQVVRESGTAVVVALVARPQRIGAGSEARHQERRSAEHEERRGPGRPPLPEGEARSTELRVRVSEADLAALDRVAVALGVDRSEATRRAIAAADKRAQRPTRARRGGA